MFKRIILLCVLIPLLSGCFWDIHTSQTTPTPSASSTEVPMVSAYRPFRVIQVCLDTPPLYPADYFHQAANALANWIEADVTVNQGGFVVYTGLIKSQSYQTDIIPPIQVGAFPADEVEPTPHPPYTPTPGQSAYQIADMQSTVDALNAQTYARWQNDLRNQHAAVARALASVKQETNKLRSYAPPYDNKGADVYGCLQDAAQHFRNSHGSNYLIIASAFVNNTPVNETGNINLYQAHVRGIWRSCPNAQVCAEHDSSWKNKFIQSGANQDVAFYDQQQSMLLAPLF